jgi:hypothetical protein
MLHNMHVASVCFQVFHTYVASVFYLDVAYTCNDFSNVSNVCFRCFTCFGRKLQVFYLDVAKVDPVLHKLQWDPPNAGHRRVSP